MRNFCFHFRPALRARRGPDGAPRRPLARPWPPGHAKQREQPSTRLRIRHYGVPGETWTLWARGPGASAAPWPPRAPLAPCFVSAAHTTQQQHTQEMRGEDVQEHGGRLEGKKLDADLVELKLKLGGGFTRNREAVRGNLRLARGTRGWKSSR